MNLRRFSYKEGNFSIYSQHYEELTTEIVQQRVRLEDFIARNPVFASSLEPVSKASLSPITSIPRIADMMIEASAKTGVGPMAAVAGTFAQLAGEKGASLGDSATIVENGGDIFATGDVSFHIGVYAGSSSLSGKCAFRITPEILPLGICSSSGTMGHSFSRGKCDLATVFAPNASLADAAATLACNMVRNPADLETTAEWISGLSGVKGVFLVMGEHAAMAGELPPIVAAEDPRFETKITRDVFSNGLQET